MPLMVRPGRRPRRGHGRAVGCADALGVPARRCAEQAAVLPAELGRAVVADRVRDFGDVAAAGDQRQPGLLETDRLLVLDRGHVGHRPEVPVERRLAHLGQRGELPDPDRVVVMVTDPLHGAGDVGEVPVREPDLTDDRALRPGQQPPQHLAPVQGREDRHVPRSVEQAGQVRQRVEQRLVGAGDGDAGRDGRPAADGARLQQHRAAISAGSRRMPIPRKGRPTEAAVTWPITGRSSWETRNSPAA